MFIYENNIWRSNVLDNCRISHGFSTREGGVSTLPHLKTMNCGFYRGDTDETVRENIKILCRLAGCSENVIGTPQIHSTEIRYVTRENAGEGIYRDVPYPCDGFVTDSIDLTLLIRVADCAPVLLIGEKEDNSPVIAAVHAGWRGAAGGIAAKAAAVMSEMGACNIRAAIGASIHPCCYRVGEDMMSEVEKLQGRDFAKAHITERDGSFFADIAGMSRELMLESGVKEVDICPECTACKPSIYHSHRITGGKRGTMGAVISIKP